MSQNEKKSNRRDRNAAPAGGFIRQSLFPLLGVAAFVGGLIYLFSPHGKMEPYKIQENPAAKKTPAPATPGTQPAQSPSRAAQDLAVKTSGEQKTPAAPKAPKLPEETLKHISRAIELVDQGKFNEAEKEFEKAAELSPTRAEVFAIWGATLRMQKKYEGAAKRLAKAYELDPSDEEVAFNYGMTKLEERKTDEAIELFKKTIQVNPNHYMAYNFLGKAYGQKRDYVSETEMYRKTLAINPDFAQAHFNIGIVLSLRKQVEEAAPHFERAIELDKEFEQPFVVNLLKSLGRYKDKEADAKKTAPDKPDHKTHTADAKPAEAKKSEGSDQKSDHKMEGSGGKAEKPSTNVNGRVVINGDPIKGEGVVFLETKNKLKVTGQKTEALTIVQKGLQFSPQHAVVPVGSVVTFANEDMEVHNIYSKSQRNQFNLGAMAGGASLEFKTNEPGPIVLRCNMHKDMIGTLFVVPNGYYARPNPDGTFAFKDVMNLEYFLQYWHPRLYPEEVDTNASTLNLNGVDVAHEFKITTTSKPGEVHDMVDQTDYNLIADNIEKEVLQAIEDWKNKKAHLSHKRMLIAITKWYEGEGLKGALIKSFSEKRGQALEDKLDALRKKIAGLGEYKNNPPTEEILKSEATQVMSQIRASIKELELRTKPGQ